MLPLSCMGFENVGSSNCASSRTSGSVMQFNKASLSRAGRKCSTLCSLYGISQYAPEKHMPVGVVTVPSIFWYMRSSLFPAQRIIENSKKLDAFRLRFNNSGSFSRLSESAIGWNRISRLGPEVVADNPDGGGGGGGVGREGSER